MSIPAAQRAKQSTSFLFTLSLVIAVFAPLAAAQQSLLDNYSPVSLEELADPPEGDWLMWRRTANHWGYSPLDQINKGNVSDLRLAWAWTMEPGKQETTPLVHDGVMFLPQACDFIEAVDATDGTPLWEYRRPTVDHVAPLSCANRNATLYKDQLIIATRDAYIVSLNATSGELTWERQIGDWTVGQHYSGGPQVFDGKVITGMSGCYYINTSCWITAHDADTGEELWRTNTVPRIGEPNGESWGDLPNEFRRGGSAWMPASFDAELNLIYVGVAVPIPWGSIQRGTRGGDVLYTNSTLALNADTGAIEWYFQHIPGGNWDLDHPFERLIVETEVTPDAEAVSWMNPDIASSQRRKVITGIPGKPGIVWTLDAATGEFLWATETNYQNVIVGVDIEGQKGITNPELDITEIGQQKLVCPTTQGGINWNSVGYSPQTNTLYTPTNNTCMNFFLRPVEPTVGLHHSSATSRPEIGPEDTGQVGQFTAIDVATGAARWTYRQRAGIGGSVLTTGGGLVFVSDDARRFRAFDAENGEILWEQILNSTAGGFPMSYSVDGVQYVAIAAGEGVNYRRHTPEIRQRGGGNVLYVFSLP
ncbi:MAG: PQQ-binding-like beta-propeller repeat protein [Gammaproteobacteria bacterium]|nr:PQQ-binding-like beta-propeller repeat protein [Gammaproteobacteria bacterium]MDP6731491.1 PQQ-binding-like beta-propeller repeat protein [Gammaproteobacteria bacterium]